MATLETDLELLEQYLDGELDSASALALETRLGSDTEFAETLAELESQRAIRSAVWQSIEPDQVTAQRLTWRVRGAMLEQDRKPVEQAGKLWNPWRAVGISSGAAACVLLGFLFGHGGHNAQLIDTAGVNSGGTPTQIVSNTPIGGQLIQYSNSARAATAKQKYSVPITNEYGQVVAWQSFDSKDQAKNFTEDLHKANPQPAAPAATGQTRLVDQEQF
jgi:hypothetical protein